MSSKRVYYLMIGLICLLFVALVAGAYGANSLLAAQATHLTELKAKSKALDKEQQQLVLAKKQIAANSDLNHIVSKIVPQDKNQAEAVREIVNIADANSIVLGSITFPSSSLGAGSLSPTSGAGNAKPFSSGGASKTSSLSQLLPVANIPGVYDLQITVQGDPKTPVPYSQLLGFLSALEHNRRTAQVSTITIQPDKENAKLITFSLTLDEYIKP